jgi:hypothetical protein
MIEAQHRPRVWCPPLPIQRAWLGLLRLAGLTILTVAYRLRIRGIEHVPEGPALIVCNHVGFIDWLFLGVALPRAPRFVMHRAHFRYRVLRWFFASARVIPIAPHKESPEALARAMLEIDAALANGEQVLLFPEGNMTPDGELQEMRPGVERIATRHRVPVVPFALRGIWGSFFSRANGEPMTKRSRRWRAPVEVVAGPPIPASDVTMAAVRERIASLRGDRR